MFSAIRKAERNGDFSNKPYIRADRSISGFSSQANTAFFALENQAKELGFSLNQYPTDPDIDIHLPDTSNIQDDNIRGGYLGTWKQYLNIKYQTEALILDLQQATRKAGEAVRSRGLKLYHDTHPQQP